MFIMVTSTTLTLATQVAWHNIFVIAKLIALDIVFYACLLSLFNLATGALGAAVLLLRNSILLQRTKDGLSASRDGVDAAVCFSAAVCLFVPYRYPQQCFPTLLLPAEPDASLPGGAADVLRVVRDIVVAHHVDPS